jgi:hypothetical protein
MTEESNQIVTIESDQDLERSAVAGAAAVERLISDRNNLRNILAAHERELAASRAAQESLKRRLGVLHQRYIELGKSIVSQLQQFDSAMREAMSDRSESQNGEAASAPGAKSQFDSHGLPVAPRPAGPNGMNGHHNGIGLPLEP